MTAPTQPPDPRVQRIASAITPFDVLGNGYAQNLARVLVEELGGRERETAKDLPSWYRLTWDKITDALTSIDPEWYHSRKDIGTHAADTIRTLAAQQRENAETIAALKGELKLARADRDFWKDEHNKACELAGQRAAELDAIKGAQEEEVWCETAGAYGNVSVKRAVRYVARSNRFNCEWTYGTIDELMSSWPELKGKRAALEALRHPAPALPVVGTCVKTSHYTLTWLADKSQNQQECERLALNEVAEYGGVACRLYRDVTPLPTEGGK